MPDHSFIPQLYEANPHFFGLFKVSTRVGLVAYKLELPAGSQIHDVFHVSLLNQKLGPISSVSPLLPPVTDTSIILPQPKLKLGSGIIRKGCYCPKMEILVKWLGWRPAQGCNVEKLVAIFEDLSRVYPFGQGCCKREGLVRSSRPCKPSQLGWL